MGAMTVARRFQIGAALIVAGCGTGATQSPDGGPGVSDSAVVSDGGAGVDLIFAPAPHPGQPVVPNNGGPVLVHPSLVTITWKGDPLKDGLNAFDQWLTKSAYWTQSMAEYGVLDGEQAASFEVPDPAPPKIDDAGLQALLAGWIAQGLVPPPTPDRLYDLYLPDGTTVTEDQGKYAGCIDFQAYHSTTVPKSGPNSVYTVIPRCHQQGFSDLDYITWGSSHEVAEASSDPGYPITTWVVLDSDVTDPFGGEIGDFCDGYPLTIEGHLVTALYSSKAAAAGERACVPAPAGPMFGAFADPATIDAPAGDTVKTTITIFSDAPLPKIVVQLYPVSAGVTVKPTSASGKNGDQIPIELQVGQATPGSLVTVEIIAQTSDYHTTSFLQLAVQ
jgi:hypothetical protein